MLTPLPVMQLAGMIILQIQVAFRLPFIVNPFDLLLPMSTTVNPEHHTWGLSNSGRASNSSSDQRLHTKRSDGATMYTGQHLRLSATVMAHIGLRNSPPRRSLMDLYEVLADVRRTLYLVSQLV